MPTKTTKTTVKSKTKVKGKGLSKKIGPFPLWSLIGVGVLIVLFIVMRKRSSGATNATTDNASGFLTPNVPPIDNASSGQPSGATPPAQSIDPGTLAAITSAIGSSSNAPTDYVTATDLQQQLDQLDNDIGAQVAAITLKPTNVNITTHTTPLKTVAKPAKKVVNTNTKQKTKPAIHYFTYKKDVKLGKGQTLHFTKGKGYYAA